jgi:hypothetical protein
MDVEIIKQCSCNRIFTKEGWKKLGYVGTSEGLEYRNCWRGSTITVPVVPEKKPSLRVVK